MTHYINVLLAVLIRQSQFISFLCPSDEYTHHFWWNDYSSLLEAPMTMFNFNWVKTQIFSISNHISDIDCHDIAPSSRELVALIYQIVSVNY